MLIKETYKPFGSKLKHFEINYQKYLNSKLKNEEEFILDMVESMEMVEIEDLISKFHIFESKKEVELIRFIDNSKYCLDFVRQKVENSFTDFKKTCKTLSYSGQFLFFTKEFLEIKHWQSQKVNLNRTEIYINELDRLVKENLVDITNSIIQSFVGVKSYDLLHALNGYLVFNTRKADIIFDKALVSDSSNLKYAFETLLDDYTLNFQGERFIPQVSIDKDHNITLNRLPIKHLKEKLLSHSFLFTTRSFTINNYLKKTDLKNEVLFKRFLFDLFTVIDKRLNKKDFDIFYYSITAPEQPSLYSNFELVETQNKLNDAFIKNPNSNKLICGLIYTLKENKFIEANSFIKALDDYFNPGAKLSKSTFDSYVYRKQEGLINFETYQDIIEKVAPKSILTSKRSTNKSKK